MAADQPELPGVVSIGNRFEGKVAIVTGAASGIGRSTALAFAREGACVVAADIDLAGVEATAHSASELAGEVAPFRVDVSEVDEVEAMVAHAVSSFGRLDVLHNNAFWAGQRLAAADIPLAEWDRTVGVTLTGVFLGCRAAIPAMIAGGGGAIVNTASAAGIGTAPKFSAYVAAKGGVLALTRSIALDYGEFGIRCNSVAPGMVDTPASATVKSDPRRLAKLVVGRIGQPIDIAMIVLFLASDHAGYITGECVVADGGRLLW